MSSIGSGRVMLRSLGRGAERDRTESRSSSRGFCSFLLESQLQ
jgi:hypothetical protein